MRPGEEEIIDLVNAVVDGEATAAQEAELQRLIVTSDQARELFDSTRAIAKRLEAMRTFDPPSDLRRSILEQVVWRRAPSPALLPREGARRHTRQRVFTFAWAAAAAVVLAFLLVGRRPMTDTGATMAPAWPIVQKVVTPRATLIVRRQGDLFQLEAVASGSPVTIGFDKTKLTLIGVSDEKDASLGKASSKVVVRPRDGASAVSVWVSVGNLEVMKTIVALR